MRGIETEQVGKEKPLALAKPSKVLYEAEAQRKTWFL